MYISSLEPPPAIEVCTHTPCSFDFHAEWALVRYFLDTHGRNTRRYINTSMQRDGGDLGEHAGQNMQGIQTRDVACFAVKVIRKAVPIWATKVETKSLASM